MEIKKMKTARLIIDGRTRNEYHCLQDGGKRQYAAWRHGPLRGRITLYEVTILGGALLTSNILFEGFASSPEYALAKMGYTIFHDIEKLGISSYMLKEEEEEDGWEKSAKKKQDEIWNHVCR